MFACCPWTATGVNPARQRETDEATGCACKTKCGTKTHFIVAAATSGKLAMSKAVADLLALLDLERLEVNLFRGGSPQSGWQRVFGGQVIGQALVAAVRTVDDRVPHSMHAYFLLAGDPK